MAMKRGLWIAVGIVIVVIILAVLFSTVWKPKQEEVIKIGAVLPLSGEAASWGENGLAGMELAVKEINEAGGVNGRTIKLIAEDSKCSADSVSAIQKLVNIDKVDMIVGFVCSAAAGPALPITTDNNIPVIIIAASAPYLPTIGQNIFRIYPSDDAQGKFVADFIYNKLGKKKAALIYVKNDWGEGLQNTFTTRFEELDGEITYSSGVLQTETDFRTEISKIKDSNVDVLYFPVYPKNAVSALKQMKEMDLNITVIGGDILGGDEVVKSGYANGLIYTIGKIDLPDDFKVRIKSLSGFENLSINILAPLGYDSVKIITLVVQSAGSIEKQAVIDALSKLTYNGISNPNIEFDENGNLKTPVFEVMIVKNNEAVPYE